ncbi:SHOCT domain-containing protein [Nocardioides panaciterrulae]|uniref:Type VI protein secretion system component VasK n=1 Tax=Nocardioides panaciterrulae TaxID=661492 RepID=A0A7Y9JAT6_9ACTN|nr:SHOCT domain-containing protein [Nocardioides panaciterrulae]NYD40554.1 type VI protein secretion system component VasK [Nocardioides panaciterrulae]
MSFWDIVWFIIISFAFVAYLMVMFSILVDLFRDREETGLMKAVWVVALIVFPLLTALVYLIVRGRGMAERQMRDTAAAQAQQEQYIREVAAKSSPADQIAQARKMLDDGMISQPEFERLKEKALV